MELIVTIHDKRVAAILEKSFGTRELVRCGYCKYNGTLGCVWGGEYEDGGIPGDDWFCADGEKASWRKSNE